MATVSQQIQQVYLGLLGRAADQSGLDYWTNEIDSGALTLEQLRANIVNEQPEYAEGLGNMTRAQVVASLYENLFDRAPDSEGLDYWVNGGGSTVNADQLVLALVNGAAASDTLALDNKVEVAQYYTAQAGDDFSVDAAAAAVADVDGSLQSVQDAKSEIDSGSVSNGQTVTLTTGIDNFSADNGNATSGDDTYKAVFSAAGTTTGADGTSLNTADIVDGGAGSDTLSYMVMGDADTKGTANTVTPANLTNIEEFVVRNLATDSNANSEEVHTLNLANVSGVTEVTNKASTAGVTFQNIGADAEVTVDAVKSGDTTFTRGTSSVTDDLTINIANGVKAGSILSSDTNNDATEVTINSTGAKNTVGAVNVTGTLASGTHTATTVNVVAESDLTIGAAGSGADLTGFDTSKDGTINVSGAGEVVLNELAGVVKTLNAASNTGGVTAVGTTAALQEVTGGTGDDSITLAGALADKGFVKLGEGSDKLDLGAYNVLKGATIELGAGDDSLVGTGSVNKDAVVDGGEGTDTLAAKLVNAVNAGAFQNFENLDLVGLGGSTLDANLFTAGNDLEKLIVSGNSGGAVTNVASDVSLEITASDASGLTIEQAGTNASATADDQFTVTFNAPASNPVAAKVVTENSLTLNKIDTINIVSDGGEKVSNVLTTLVSDEMETLNITGDNDLQLGSLDQAAATASTTLKTVDASGLSGSLKMDLASVNGDLSVKLGDGDDVITASVVNDADTAGNSSTISSAASFDKIANFDMATDEEVSAGQGYDLIKFADTLSTEATNPGALDFNVAADATGATNAVGVSDGVVDFSSLSNGPQTFADAVNQINTDVAGNGSVVAFEYGSNTYLFAQNDSADVVVELTGVTDVSALAESGTSDSFYIA